MSGKQKPKIRKECLSCKKTFDVSPSVSKRGGGKYCSPECQRNGSKNREFINCAHCGKSFESAKSNERKYCSHECYWNSISKSGNREKIHTKCLHCNKLFTKHPSNPKVFCCIDCRNAHYVGKQRITSSTQYICMSCGKTYEKRDLSRKGKYCSSRCAYNYRHFSTHVKKVCATCNNEFDASISGLNKGKGRYCSLSCYRKGKEKTYIEEFIEKVLNSLGVFFHPQHTIEKYTCDFFLPMHSIIIEVDGDYWHSLPNVKDKDKRRDDYMKSIGLKTIRFSESEINKNPAKCRNKIAKILR